MVILIVFLWSFLCNLIYIYICGPRFRLVAENGVMEVEVKAGSCSAISSVATCQIS
jgi:hypothetical protein